ncbi:imelysin family protein [Nitratireductor thuwali]|uniref:Imelysin-like domain-containing protein n=1 Tax=Nitratireductor thuwali TaxID=2267699 RepID=A0ABY5MLL7_9HYPH|nr:hypothetical protein NTH_02122 [Nitratireductor thuwali]
MPIRSILCAVVLLCAGAAAAQEQRVPEGIGANVADGYARVSLEAFAGATARLRAGLEAVCAEPTREGLDDMRATFADTVRAWGPVSVLRFGPLVADNRFERIFFWPDARGVTLRQVQGVLAEKEPETATVEGLGGKSVALQGLPALEYVLFGTGSDAIGTGEEDFRCRYGAAIAGNAAARAGELIEAWSPGAAFHGDFAHPGEGNALYRSPLEVAGEVVKALGTSLQFARDAELLPALGETPSKANGKRAPLWRSDLTFDLVGTQIQGTLALIDAAGFDEALDEERQAILDALRFDLQHALEALEEIEAPAEAAFADEQDRGRIAYASTALQSANATVSERFSAAIGLTMGFNALDGD